MIWGYSILGNLHIIMFSNCSEFVVSDSPSALGCTLHIPGHISQKSFGNGQSKLPSCGSYIPRWRLKVDIRRALLHRLHAFSNAGHTMAVKAVSSVAWPSNGFGLRVYRAGSWSNKSIRYSITGNRHCRAHGRK